MAEPNSIVLKVLIRMKSSDGYLIGVDIGPITINLCRLNFDGAHSMNVQINTPNPAMPGAITVALCEGIDSIDPFCLADFVGVSFPGKVDAQGRIAESCTLFPEWLHVPLADWLETRLSRQVTLINSERCMIEAQDFLFKSLHFDKDLSLSFGAAHLACKRFSSFVDTSRNVMKTQSKLKQ